MTGFFAFSKMTIESYNPKTKEFTIKKKILLKIDLKIVKK